MPKAKKILSVPQQHQFKIAKETLHMPYAMAGVMGGMTHDEAEKFLIEVAGWTQDQVDKYVDSMDEIPH